MAAKNLLLGLFKPAYYEDIEGSFVIDVRTPDVFKINGIKGAINIPLAELRKRYNEIPKDKKVILICNTGYTSYLASRILIQKGFNNVYSFMGGTKLYSEIEKNKQNKTIQKTLVAANAKTSESALKIDACGLSCPGPVMKLAESLEKIKEGETIEITSNDKGFYSDVQAWCVSTNNTLINLTDKDKKITATIQKGNFEKITPKKMKVKQLLFFQTI